jgi:phosphonate transport system permease protein
MSTTVTKRRRWSPPPLIKNPLLRWSLILAALAYLVLAIASLEVNWLRVYLGLERGAAFISGFIRPDFVSRWGFIYQGILESLTMTVVATAVGIVLAIPVSFGAARNISSLPIYLLCRGFITISRSFQEVIIALFFVVMVGFGPLAGVLTLAFASIGFIAKLLAEDIENIDESQLEAIRATGASWLQVMSFGVTPQVMPRFIGLSVYRLDINFRESSVIGIVGAGGIGAALNTAFARYEYGVAGAIILVIVALVLIAEYASGLIRARVQ